MSTTVFFVVTWFGAVLALCLIAAGVTLYEGVKRRRFERQYLDRFGPNVVIWPPKHRISIPRRWE